MEIKKLLEKVVKAKLNTEEILTAKLLTEIEVELEEESNLVEAPVGMPSETLSCEQVRNNTIEECAKHLEELAEKANDVLVEERHILQEDTVELFRNDIDHARRLANNLRELASKP